MASANHMSFLRPLSLPRLSSIHPLQRRLLIQSCPQMQRRGEVTKAEDLANNSPSSPLSPAAHSPVQPKSQSSIDLTPLPYHVHRTPSQKLPIYQVAKRGGNLHQTRIRKIEGDVEKLRDEIRIALGLKEERVVINRLNGNIIVKGWYRDKIKQFLEDLHF
ncbi:hypothetical protein N7G274_007840 [Stereocaulon virgatum]|uniref:Large ribosomal subunit protein mL49 n=1 Tax=Stereocaulon virgatum TaxID=373712 RepID=A0ABR4A1R0_9LECA